MVALKRHDIHVNSVSLVTGLTQNVPISDAHMICEEEMVQHKQKSCRFVRLTKTTMPAVPAVLLKMPDSMSHLLTF